MTTEGERTQELIGKMLAEATTQAQFHEQIVVILKDMEDHSRHSDIGGLAALAILVNQTRSMRIQMTLQGQLMSELMGQMLNLTRELYGMVTALKGLIGDPTAIDQKVEQLEEEQVKLKEVYDGVQEIISARVAAAQQKNQQGV